MRVTDLSFCRRSETLRKQFVLRFDLDVLLIIFDPTNTRTHTHVLRILIYYYFDLSLFTSLSLSFEAQKPPSQPNRFFFFSPESQTLRKLDSIDGDGDDDRSMIDDDMIMMIDDPMI